MESIRQVLMRRDGLTASEAENLIDEARADLYERLAESDSTDDLYNICEEYFGLEPDYLIELI